MKRFLLLALFMMMLAVSARAGGVLGVQGTNHAYLFPQHIGVAATIQNQVAVTVTTQTFRNTTGGPAKLNFFFPLPVNAVATGLRWWQHGELHVATISGTPQDTAGTIGSGGGIDAGDPAMQHYLGQSPFIFPFKSALDADSTIVVELTYMELLRYSVGRVSYIFPSTTASLGAGTTGMQFELTLECDRDITSMTCDSHPKVAVQHGKRTARATLADDAFLADRDIAVDYALAQGGLGVSMLSIKPGAEDGYFLMLAEPDPATTQDRVIDKTFTFIIDVSGSMAGPKLQAAKDAASYTIQHLNSDDRFNVIAFSSSATPFATEPVEATPFNVGSGLHFIDTLTAGGGTNLEMPLLLGLSQRLPDTTANVIVFLTDGIAALDQAKIQAANTSNTRIFVFGIGGDVNQSLLTQLAANNSGLAEFLGTDDVGKRIPAFYNKIRNPLLQNINLSFTAGDVSEMYPVPLPDIYVGEQLVVLGRYRQPGPAQALVHGTAAGKGYDYTYDVRFTADSLTQIFIPKMWAKYKIDVLLVYLQKVPANSNQWKEWRDEIIRLGKQYGILTPFTSFTDPGTGGGPSSVIEEPGSTDGAAIVLRVTPNPFPSSTSISFSASAREHASVIVYDIDGNVIATLLDAVVAPGEHAVPWDGTDAQGVRLPAGSYLCRITVGTTTRTVRLVIVR